MHPLILQLCATSRPRRYASDLFASTKLTVMKPLRDMYNITDEMVAFQPVPIIDVCE